MSKFFSSIAVVAVIFASASASGAGDPADGAYVTLGAVQSVRVRADAVIPMNRPWLQRESIDKTIECMVGIPSGTDLFSELPYDRKLSAGRELVPAEKPRSKPLKTIHEGRGYITWFTASGPVPGDTSGRLTQVTIACEHRLANLTLGQLRSTLGDRFEFVPIRELAQRQPVEAKLDPRSSTSARKSVAEERLATGEESAKRRSERAL